MLTSSLVEDLLAFRRARDWEQFHNLRTLSTSLAMECSELMEITQWASDHDIAQIALKEAGAIQDEVADIVILLTYLASDLQINIDEAVRLKLAKNELKYPVERARGVSTKYDKL